MLKQEDLAFIKAMSNTELSSVFFRELRKAMAVAEKKKALAAYKAQTSRDIPQTNPNKMKA
jgi:hypothetical protein